MVFTEQHGKVLLRDIVVGLCREERGGGGEGRGGEGRGGEGEEGKGKGIGRGNMAHRLHST